MRHTLAFLCAIGSVLAAPILDQRQLLSPKVNIKNGTVIGETDGLIDTFNGIPFAQPPVGNLRLKPPQRITAAFPSATINAIGEPTSCPQFLVQVNTGNVPSDALGLLLNTPIVQAATNTGEDCLTLNVQRPSTANSTSKLPVVAWIYGGGFGLGSTQMYNGNNIVQTSTTLGNPIIYVEMNYRVAGLGFLAGKELQAEGSTNLGLRDQRLALEWIQENIADFGGDPDKVTLWGESAGAISVYDQTIINGGDHTYNGKPLFRGAIMNSGSFIPAESVAHEKAQAIYDLVVRSAGCAESADTLACLRSVDLETFLNAMDSANPILSYGGLNLPYLPRPDPNDGFFSVSPEVALYAGNYAKVPVIIGDQEDEGTLFSLSSSNITTTEQVVDFLTTIFPSTSRSMVESYVATYPDNASAGSPFRTGILNNIYPQFKRVAAISGDITFNLRRRQYLDVVSSVVPSWSYLDSHLYGTPVLGTFHGSDVLSSFYNLPSAINAYTYRAYYVSFINSLDPNALGTTAPLISWPKYTTAGRSLVQLQALLNNNLKDDFRSTSYSFLQANPNAFRI